MTDRYEIRLVRSVSRALAEQLPQPVAAAIWEFVIGPLAENPHRVGKSLSGQLVGHHSARRGSYRVVYTISEEARMITIVRVDHRRSVYHR